MATRRVHDGQLARGQGDIGTLALRGAAAFAKRHKVISGSYVFGLLVLLLVGSGTKLTLDQRRQYDHIMSTIDLNAEFDASNRYAHAMHAYRASKGWFSCDSLCQRNKARMEDARAALEDIRAEGYNRMSDAKRVAGLFSEVGVGEVKDSFWERFHAGKRFAKRQSMWDAMFMGMRSMGRDESFAEYALKMIVQVLINFSIGLVMALFIFIFGLWGIVRSYQPDPLTALAFFLSAVCAAFAFVTTYLLLIYGATAGGLYGMAKMAETNMRIEQGRRQPRMQQRPHYY
uniref:Uncharacterized protein n=1 Tax=Trieres chinensis TaxID=1514140 RepID=A0A7S2A693_TRICV|mmetsp:Transcript_40028/g.81736  ORF Transcript_40028/g.81736 Transcript_40028/m.81736 type:complete len:287 (+) Transcript_40028:174-1034(+)|eukprot:CAMPEP_0183309684 /NCGR_PEP_ID=MMETSP0160_2-20130417/25484_1 /TAXON_ID=2839 ORGANISM="Odontella Sinensis, Strain Grunow 1884" /NCGR_SAMPLE_ID=MMETSP0160_2 /ASSEMBLY_ACC=CAM_ASM_000250 /LENGTH=286 /DNA_ID=CAMNT_0025473745 /DNA_START=174 /DNA_END=1034 /DNA_ORIENTATION=-